MLMLALVCHTQLNVEGDTNDHEINIHKSHPKQSKPDIIDRTHKSVPVRIQTKQSHCSKSKASIHFLAEYAYYIVSFLF